MSITYLTGDATYPQTNSPAIIAHICNDVGAWGSGFVLSISSRWKKPEFEYRRWYRSGEHFKLGEVQLVSVGADIYVMNMLAQHGLIGRANPKPIRYNALRQCLTRLAEQAEKLSASVHMPRIGCGRAGGKWEDVAPHITNELSDKGISVFVYDF